MKEKREKKITNKTFSKIIVAAIGLLIVAFILKVAPNYIRDEMKDKTKLVINNSNVTKSLKQDVYIEDGVVYLSQEDIKNYFDEYIFYDNQYTQIVTSSDTKVAALPVGKKQITINGAGDNIYATVIKKNDKYYIPFSEISKKIYNVETIYIEKTNTVVLDSLDRSLTYATSNKNNSVKYKPTMFSKTMDTIKKGDNAVVVTNIGKEKIPSGWKKVRTANGQVGYVKEKSLTNVSETREDLKISPQIEGKISLVWDYFSEYARAPKRTEKIEGINVISPAFFALSKQGKGKMDVNIGNDGVQYIEWAHNNGYKVWPMVSNNSMKETTSEIMRDYKLRETLINNIVELVVTYDLDGINIDFENMYSEDKELFSRFMIELTPRLKEIGKVTSVDVTAPDGSDTWSLCFDRHVLSDVADYIMFMAYDQHGVSSTSSGSVAGYDWVEANIKKFLGQEEVNPNKLVLGMPFYTRLWKESNDKLDSSVVSMKNISTTIPNNVTLKWKDDVKQYYAEYEKDGITYKMWIEDESSIKEKLSLIERYELAGGCYWAKDRESSTIWNVISEKLEIK